VDTVSETDRIAAAEAYIDALVSHNADAVPFADDCTRIEVGMKTGFSGNHLRRSVSGGPQYRVICGASDRKFAVDGDQVHATFTIETKVVVGGRRVVARVDETFLIPAADGKIHHIRAKITPAIRREP
jgi:hypothetical protein